MLSLPVRAEVLAALEFAREGTRVVVNYLGSEAQARDVVQEIKRLGSETIAVRADVSQGDEVKALVSAALETFGRVDILVNNAAIYLPYSLKSEDEGNWDRMMAVTVKGVLLCSNNKRLQPTAFGAGYARALRQPAL